MPIMRTYQCPDCGGSFQHLHMKREEPPPEFCGVCGEYMGEDVQPELPQVNIGKATTKAVDAVARDYQTHHRVGDLKDNLRMGDAGAVPIRNAVTDYMDQIKGAGGSEWGFSPATTIGAGGGASNLPAAEHPGRTLGMIQQRGLK